MSDKMEDEAYDPRHRKAQEAFSRVDSRAHETYMRNAGPIHQIVEYPVHDDPQITLVLGLEALLARAEREGAKASDIASALSYVSNRPRSTGLGAPDNDQEWPAEHELPPGPYRNPEETL